jgi:hypothetical protein
VLAVLEVGNGWACDHPRDLQLNGVGPWWPNSRVPWSSSMAMWTWTSSSSPGPQVLLDDVRPSAHCDVLPSGRRPSLLHRGLDRLRTTGPQRHQELHPTVTAYLVIRTRHPSHQHTAYRPAPISTLPLVAVYRMAAFLPLHARPEIVRGQQCAGGAADRTSQVHRATDRVMPRERSRASRADSWQAVRRRDGTAAGPGRPARRPARAQASAAVPAAGRASAGPERW